MPPANPPEPAKRALITGITGQDGLYLGELLAAEGYEVYGLVHGDDNPGRELAAATIPGVRLLTGDLTDPPSLVRAFAASDPSEVYNLGAISFAAQSWSSWGSVSAATGQGVLNVLEAARLHAGGETGRVRFCQASSSEMFGRAQEVPQTERTLLWPRSPYGLAKMLGHHLTINYREHYGMHASSAILYNHESPRRGPQFVTRKVTLAAARIALGQQRTLVLGDLDARRDWGFAGDYVRAMWLMLQQERADDYVIATGVTHSIRELLDRAFAAVGIDDWTGYVVQDERFVRPAEERPLGGDAAKAHRVLGWEPRVGFEELIRTMAEADLAVCAADGDTS
jgi:GDPmannose 4,6-dehydratase